MFPDAQINKLNSMYSQLAEALYLHSEAHTNLFSAEQKKLFQELTLLYRS